jgi:hypothetical protein
MTIDAHLARCDVCRRKFEFGFHQYYGKQIPLYEIAVCNSCWDANWDGWAPHLEERVTAKLKAAGKSLPTRNSKDLLPRA